MLLQTRAEQGESLGVLCPFWKLSSPLSLSFPTTTTTTNTHTHTHTHTFHFCFLNDLRTSAEPLAMNAFLSESPQAFLLGYERRERTKVYCGEMATGACPAFLLPRCGPSSWWTLLPSSDPVASQPLSLRIWLGPA